VVLITIDTLRADAIGSYGHASAATPRIDRLAAGGIRFTESHAHNVITLASHANILSGRYPIDHGVRDNAGFRFPASMPTLATILHDRGYATGAFVSAFPLDGRFGLNRGFDEYDDRFVGSGPRPALLEQERKGVETIGRAMSWLQGQGDRPTFCFVHLYEPHFPYDPPEPYASQFRQSPYDGEVAAADAALAPLIDPILAAGRDGRTLVVLTSDHGESLGEHGEATHGIFAYEATLRVPLIVFAPGWLEPRVVSEPARHVDILPTILDVLGMPIPEGLRGASLVPIARGEHSATDRDTYFEALSGLLNRGWAPVTGVIHRGTKFIDLPIPELYDLPADPGERHNLSDAQPQRRDAMRASLAPFASAADVTRPVSERAEARERLRSLGYSSGGPVGPRTHFTPDDDPKRLIASDTELQAIVGRYLSGDLAGALQSARAFAQAHPANAVALITQAQLERESGHLPDAIAAMRRAMSLAPGNVTTAALLGAYLTQDGRPEAAVALLQPLAAGPDPDVDVLVALGLAQARQGRFDAALATLGTARGAAPHNAMLLVDAGTISMMAGRTADARQAFTQAIAESPSLARAHSSLGVIEADAGHPDLAVASWRTAVSLDPSEYERLFTIGVSMARGGNAAKARLYLTFAAESAPSERYQQQAAQARAWLAAQPRR
jgi:arylsulfatase A-like enzyme/Flp pilus assembly protein TadD